MQGKRSYDADNLETLSGLENQRCQESVQGPKYLSDIIGKWGKRHLGGHDLVRRVNRQGEIF